MTSPKPTAPTPPVKGKSFWTAIGGAFLAVLGFLSQSQVISAMPPKVGAVVGAVGVVAGVVGNLFHTQQAAS
jgi:CDP-diglyceride synthetase